MQSFNIISIPVQSPEENRQEVGEAGGQEGAQEGDEGLLLVLVEVERKPGQLVRAACCERCEEKGLKIAHV